MNHLVFLTLSEVLQLHAESLDHFGGQAGVRDIGLIQSAIAEPQQSFGGEYLHPTLASMAAAYFFHLNKNHGFLDGNKRIGVRAAYMFLALNNCEIDFPLEETESLAVRVASGQTDKKEVTEFISKLLSQSSL